MIPAPRQAQAGGFHVPELNSGARASQRLYRSDGFRMVARLEALPKTSHPELERPDFEWDTPSLGHPHRRENVRYRLKIRQSVPPEQR
jgi:hypothetical protein